MPAPGEIRPTLNDITNLKHFPGSYHVNRSAPVLSPHSEKHFISAVHRIMCTSPLIVLFKFLLFI